MPTISVIIPAYNAEKTILETLQSVQQQTFFDFEIIIINDGSTDRTLELLGTVKDHRLKIFSYENGGVSIARNRGLFHATGEYIALLDADDLWTPDKLELQLEALRQNPGAGVAYSWAYYMDEKGETLQADAPLFFAGNVYAELLFRDFIVSGSNCLIRKEAVESVGEFDPRVPSASDWDYWIRLAKDWPFVVVPKLQIFYRYTPGSVSSKVDLMEQNNLKVIEKSFQSAPAELQYLKNHSLANTYRLSAHLYIKRIGTKDAAKKAADRLGKAIRLYPAILRESWTRNLLVKVLLIHLISPKTSHHLFQFIRKIRALLQPKPQQSELSG